MERFTGKATEWLGARVPRDVRAEVMRRADTEGRTASSWIKARLIRALLEEPEPQPYPPSRSSRTREA